MSATPLECSPPKGAIRLGQGLRFAAALSRRNREEERVFVDFTTKEAREAEPGLCMMLCFAADAGITGAA
jgi:hypothetical protein